MNLRTRAVAGAVAILGAAVLATPDSARTSAISPHQQHTMSGTGVYGIGQYTQRGSGYNLQAYVHDTRRDGYCAEVWLDFTTDPHEHHGPLMTYACGKGVDGWGATRHANSSRHRIRSFRMAICRAKKPAVRYSSRNRVSRPVGCREWNNRNASGWAVLAWQANDAKITAVH
jgi:hypothetical protein